MQQIFSRSGLLLGEAALQKLGESTVAVFGVGGVGSYAVEGLARSGIGRLILVDSDVVVDTNINRQLIALHSTVGQDKVAVAKNRILDINPRAHVVCHKDFYLQGGDFLKGSGYAADYVVDCIDTVSAKLNLVQACNRMRIPIVSAMGAGDKKDPTRFEVADIYDTSVCPLCRVMRRELKTRAVQALKVVYSKEAPVAQFDLDCADAQTAAGGAVRRHTPGSLPFVPSVMGLILASEVVKDILASQ